MEPIVRAHSRARCVLRLICGWTAAWAWLAAGTAVLAQPPQPDAEGAPSESQPAVQPAQDDSRYDPPLTDAAKVKEWLNSNGRLNFKRALKLERLSNPDREELTRATQMYLYRMTLRENRTSVYDVVREFLDDVNSQLTSAEARNYVNNEVVRIGPQLLGQPPNVRLNLMILAASLSSDPRADPPRPFVGAAPLFVSVLEDPSQFVDSKIWATKGLTRICRDGDVAITERSRIATQFVTALNSPQALDPKNWWFRMRLVEGLGETGLCYDLTRQPIVIDTLMTVLSSPRERWLVRSCAARAVTQLPWEPADNVNVPLVCYQVSRLVRDMAEARNNSLKAPHWGYCFVNAYLSFTPQTQAQKQKRWGLLHQVTRPGLAQHQPLAQSAYQAVLPIINSVTRNLQQPAPVANEDIQRLNEWLQNNVPQDWKPTPASKQLQQTEARTDPMAIISSPPGAPTAERGPAPARSASRVAVPAAALPAQ